MHAATIAPAASSSKTPCRNRVPTPDGFETGAQGTYPLLGPLSTRPNETSRQNRSEQRSPPPIRCGKSNTVRQRSLVVGEIMETITSKDGTTIEYERMGRGGRN